MTDEIEPDASVWISTGFSGDNSEKCLHVDPDCRNLSEAKAVVEKRREMYTADQRVCQICTGQYEGHTKSGRTDAYQALKNATPDEVGP